MKDFLIQTTKVAIVLLMLALASLTVYKGIEFVRKKLQYEAALASPKTWNTLTLHSLENAQVSLVTKWQDGFLSYQFEMKGYPNAFTQANASQCISSPKFILTFMDKSGFKIFDQEVMFSEVKQVVDTSGTPVGLSAKGGTYKPAGMYGKAASWDVVWVS